MLFMVRAVLPNQRSHRAEKPAHHKEDQLLPAAARENPRTATGAQGDGKQINTMIKKPPKTNPPRGQQ